MPHSHTAASGIRTGPEQMQQDSYGPREVSGPYASAAGPAGRSRRGDRMAPNFLMTCVQQLTVCNTPNAKSLPTT